MNGVEKADSVCWDAHKMMGVPLICSAFLIKDPPVLRRLCDHTNVAHYLFHSDAELDDLGRYRFSVLVETTPSNFGLIGVLVAMRAGPRWLTG